MPADHDHVVGAAQDAAGQPAVGVAAGRPGDAVLDHVAGAVADHREADAAQGGQHQLPALALAHRLQVGAQDLADELALVHQAGRRPRCTGSRSCPPRSGRRGPRSGRRSPPRCGCARRAARRPARRCRPPAGSTPARPPGAPRPPPPSAAARRWACTAAPSPPSGRSSAGAARRSCRPSGCPGRRPAPAPRARPRSARAGRTRTPARRGRTAPMPAARKLWARQSPHQAQSSEVSRTRSGGPVVPEVWCTWV